jgi:hypothetical protein
MPPKYMFVVARAAGAVVVDDVAREQEVVRSAIDAAGRVVVNPAVADDTTVRQAVAARHRADEVDADADAKRGPVVDLDVIELPSRRPASRSRTARSWSRCHPC